MTTTTEDWNETDGRLERYRAIEYSGENGTVSILQDTENDAAWVQSDLTVEVRR